MMHSTRLKRAVLAVVGAGAVAASLGVPSVSSVHATAAADSGARAGTQASVTMDDLLHPVDISYTFAVIHTITSRVGGLDGGYGLSACTGETRTSDVVGSRADLYHGLFTGRINGGARFRVVEHVAGQATATRAAKKYHTIVRKVSACQDEPVGHWRYGRAYHVSTDAGTATWMVAYTGAGARDGGVIVARSGRHLAVVETRGAGTASRVGRLAVDTLRWLP